VAQSAAVGPLDSPPAAGAWAWTHLALGDVRALALLHSLANLPADARHRRELQGLRTALTRAGPAGRAAGSPPCTRSWPT
jgi:hypothetical protein